MPPWAGKVCGRRGLSWYQNDVTLYPCSPRVAAAEPPARPVPTTMTVIFRRLAGLTSRPRKRRSLHRSLIGTSVGALVSAMGSPTVKRSRGMEAMTSLVDEPEDDGVGDDEVPGDQHHGEGEREGVDRPLAPLVALAEGLRGAPDPVPQVHPQQDQRDRVNRGDERVLEALHQALVGRGLGARRVR